MSIPDLINNPIPLQGGGFYRFAHHPHCDRHLNHLIWIRGRPLCLGCTCMYSGIALGVGISLITEWKQFSIFSWLFVHIILVMPTIIQIKIQFKRFKMVSRTLLGIAISTYFLSGLLFIDPPIRLSSFVVLICLQFVVAYRALKWLRNKYTPSPCTNCPLGFYPVCEWNIPELIKENNSIKSYLVNFDPASQIQQLR